MWGNGCYGMRCYVGVVFGDLGEIGRMGKIVECG